MKKTVFLLFSIGVIHLYSMDSSSLSSREKYRLRVQRKVRNELISEMRKLKPATINTPMSNGRMPLYNAIDMFNATYAGDLIDRDINEYFLSPVIDELFSRGADLRIKSGVWGNTPLHIAAEGSKLQSLLHYMQDKNKDLLLELLAIKNDLGDIPLHNAIKAKRTHNVRLLVEAGNNVTQKGSDGKTALEMACDGEIPEDLALIIGQLGFAGAPISDQVVDFVNSDSSDPKEKKILKLCKEGLQEVVQKRHKASQDFLISLDVKHQSGFYLGRLPPELRKEIRDYLVNAPVLIKS